MRLTQAAKAGDWVLAVEGLPAAGIAPGTPYRVGDEVVRVWVAVPDGLRVTRGTRVAGEKQMTRCQAHPVGAELVPAKEAKW